MDDKEVIKQLHSNLDHVVSLFIQAQGSDYGTIQIALDVLKEISEKYNLPMTMANIEVWRRL